MDDYRVKGEVAESNIDNDRVRHSEVVAATPEENTVRIKENLPYAETRNETRDDISPEAIEEEGTKRNAFREKVQSITGIFATVAVTAVAAVAVSFREAPVVNVSAFDIGYDYVEYTADVVNETGDSLVLSVSNDYQSYEKEFDSGEVTDVVADLKPDTKYTFSIRSSGGLKRTYYSKNFTTSEQPTEYEPKVTNVITSRKAGDNVLYVKFEVSDLYSYYSNYKLVIKRDENEVGTEIDASSISEETHNASVSEEIQNSPGSEEIPISAISEEIPIDLDKYNASSYTIQLTADTAMPKDNQKNIHNKTIYSAKIKN